MWKKALPVTLVAGLALAGCGSANNDDVPSKDETPMEDTDLNQEQRAREWTPEMGEDTPNGTTGPNMDGLEDDREMDEDGLMHEGQTDQNTLDGNGNAEDGKMDANSTPDGGNTTGTGNNGGSKVKEDKDRD